MQPVIKPFLPGFVANCYLCSEPINPVKGKHNNEDIEYCIIYKDKPICSNCAHMNNEVWGRKGLASMLENYRPEYSNI